jgi:hypothetical protein
MYLQDSWAICRIFKKANSTTQRALSHSWVSPLPETNTTDHMLAKGPQCNQFISSENMSLTSKASCSPIQFSINNDMISAFSPFDFSSYKSLNQIVDKSTQLPISSTGELHSSFLFSPLETSIPAKCTVDLSSMLLNMPSSMLGDFGTKATTHDSIDYGGVPQEHCNGFSINLLQDMQGNVDGGHGEHANALMKNPNLMHTDDQWETVRYIGFPFSLPSNVDAWKPNLVWDSSPCPSELSTSFSTTKSYTK